MPLDLDALLNEATQPVEDQTTTVRETPDGPATDVTHTEQTRFDGAYPATTRETRYAPPLPCGHHAGLHGFGGYCRCSRAVCQRCHHACRRCARTLGPCCARPFRGERYCPWCRRLTVLGAILRWLATPFTMELPDDW